VFAWIFFAGAYYRARSRATTTTPSFYFLSSNKRLDRISEKESNTCTYMLDTRALKYAVYMYTYIIKYHICMSAIYYYSTTECSQQ